MTSRILTIAGLVCALMLAMVRAQPQVDHSNAPAQLSLQVAGDPQPKSVAVSRIMCR